MPKGAGRLHSSRCSRDIQPERIVCDAHGKTDYHNITDSADAMLGNGSVECLFPPLRRGLMTASLHGAGSHGVSGLRAPADAECNGLSTKQRCDNEM